MDALHGRASVHIGNKAKPGPHWACTCYASAVLLHSMLCQCANHLTTKRRAAGPSLARGQKHRVPLLSPVYSLRLSLHHAAAVMWGMPLGAVLRELGKPNPVGAEGRPTLNRQSNARATSSSSLGQSLPSEPSGLDMPVISWWLCCCWLALAGASGC